MVQDYLHQQYLRPMSMYFKSLTMAMVGSKADGFGKVSGTFMVFFYEGAPDNPSPKLDEACVSLRC